LQETWRAVPIAWLAGGRRSGKTTLAQSLGPDQTLYVNCDLSETEDAVKNPSLFFKGCAKPIVVFDEVHHLKDPSRLLKIGTDVYPQLRILATGSSTLAASKSRIL
jgi:predicted AAA+ superfamily ATPase